MKGKVYTIGFFGTLILGLLLMAAAGPLNAKGPGRINSIEGQAVKYSVIGAGDPTNVSCLATLKGKKGDPAEQMIRVPREDPNKGSLCDAIKSAYTHNLMITVHFMGSPMDKTLIPIRIDYPPAK